MAMKMSGGKGKVSGAVKFKLGTKPPKQAKTKGISTPFKPLMGGR